MLYFTCDHNGFTLKKFLIQKCNENQMEIEDVWPDYDKEDDYPDAAKALAQKMQNSEDFGVAICGTGQGICMSLNKFDHVRAGISLDSDVVKKMREHNNANCLCFPAFNENKDLEKAFELLQIFLQTKPDSAQRHQRRVDKMNTLSKA